MVDSGKLYANVAELQGFAGLLVGTESGVENLTTILERFGAVAYFGREGGGEERDPE